MIIANNEIADTYLKIDQDIINNVLEHMMSPETCPGVGADERKAMTEVLKNLGTTPGLVEALVRYCSTDSSVESIFVSFSVGIHFGIQLTLAANKRSVQ